MLALPTQRHHLSTIPSPPSSHSSYQQLPQQFAAQHLYDQKLLNDYVESQQQIYGTSSGSAPNPYMTSAYTNFANPAIRIQQSTPTPQLPQGFAQPPMLSANNTNTGLESWNNYGNVQGQSLQTPSQNQNRNRGHQRASSSSSVGSSASQYQAVGPSSGYQSFQNHLPTPSQTPTQDSFMNGNNFSSNFAPNMDHTMSAHMSMKQALMDQSDDVPDYAHSTGQSVSSYGHDSPATPHTAQDDMDFKTPANDMRPVPKFERTYTDIAADTGFYEPSAVTQTVSQSKPAQSSLLSPYRSNANENVQRALQAAQYARSQSPSSTASRSDSPFRKSSPYRQPSNSFNSPMNTAVAAREQNRQADAAYAMKSQMQPSDDSEPKTISPKDALLDFRESDEESKVPLFPDSGASEYDGQYNGGEQYRTATQSSFDAPSSSQSYGRDSWATPQFSPNFSTATAPSLQQSSSFNFATPSIGNMHSLPMNAPSQYRSTPNTMASAVDQTPEFPARVLQGG
jgi:hypothetical protein